MYIVHMKPTAYHSYVMVEKGSAIFFFRLPQSSSRIKMNSKPKIVFFYVRNDINIWKRGKF